MCHEVVEHQPRRQSVGGNSNEYKYSLNVLAKFRFKRKWFKCRDDVLRNSMWEIPLPPPLSANQVLRRPLKVLPEYMPYLPVSRTASPYTGAFPYSIQRRRNKSAFASWFYGQRTGTRIPIVSKDDSWSLWRIPFCMKDEVQSLLLDLGLLLDESNIIILLPTIHVPVNAVLPCSHFGHNLPVPGRNTITFSLTLPCFPHCSASQSNSMFLHVSLTQHSQAK